MGLLRMVQRRVHSSLLQCLTSLVVGLIVGFNVFLFVQNHPRPHTEVRHLEMTATEAASAVAASALRAVNRPPQPPPSAPPPPPPPPTPAGPDLLFVGVMTANQFLDTRAVAVYDTWGQDVPGKLAFFTSAKSGGRLDMPIVRLKGVTDQYPPQKKSFMMLKYMHDHYIDKYEWFMRADDDVYVRANRLQKFLRGINSSQPMFIGQAGLGNKAEFGQLNLNKQDNYCMGGPGIVMSRATLKLIYPHIRTCLSNLYTDHEDVEIGRCVKKYAGVSCLWNYEMREIFYHDQKGTEAYMGSLKYRHIMAAMTLHPIKVPALLYKLHNFFLGVQIQEVQKKKIERYRQIMRSTPKEEQDSLTPLVRRLGAPPVLSKLAVDEPEQMINWAHLGSRFMLHSEKASDPRIYAAFHLREGVRDATSALMDYMLSFSQERGRSLTLQELNYGYHRVDPLNGVDMVLDLVLKYVRFRGKKVVQTVRRHAYLQQPFGVPEVRSVSRQDSKTVVNLIVGLAGKLEQFNHFCDNLETVGLDHIKVVFVIYEKGVPEETMTALRARIASLRERFSLEEINTHTVTEEAFSRAGALTIGKSLLTDDALALFIDIDILFDHNAIENVRQFTIRGKQAYFPIVFSQYDPSIVAQDSKVTISTPVVDEHRGKFRFFGFGIAALFVSDVDAVGGFNQGIKGWGKEDVDFVDRVLKHPRNYTVIRTAEPGMVHVFHPIHCAADLAPDQAVMCKGTKNSFQAGKQQLAWDVTRNDRVLQFARTLPKKALTGSSRTKRSSDKH